MKNPIVAVVGRPNVGKSTLFNKIIGRRIAIVEDTPGVTRDRIYADAEWCGRKFTLIDTGGIEPDAKTEMLSKMRAQARVAIESADVVLFLVDIKSGLTANDSEVAAMLRKSSKPIILVCNKADTPGAKPSELYEFYNLGLGEPFAVSAVHGIGVGDLLDKVVENLPQADTTNNAEDTAIKVAIVGKPNAGKSSIINKFLGKERVIVSEIAGTTRDAVDVRLTRNDREFVLIDTAGMRRKGKVEEDIERYSVIRALSSVERADVVFMVIDAMEGVTEQDSKIAGFAHEKGKATVIAVNKWDLVEKNNHSQKKFEREIRAELPFMAYAPIVFISALTGQRVEKSLETIEFVSQQTSRRITTGALNECLQDAVARVQPPSDKGKRLKMYYASQVDIKPPMFVLFVNDKELCHFSYMRFLENRIRETFEFDGTPIIIKIKERGKP